LAESVQRFQGWSDRYAVFRPGYPESPLRALSLLIIGEPMPAGSAVADVGCGSGIFTRQLRRLLPDTIPIFGVEPASDMRLRAQATAPSEMGITYVGGTAENLPFGAGTVRAVVAATAAQWFDRPAFYEEARRSLMPSGLLAIIEYVRDIESSTAATAVVSFLAQYGGPRAYRPADYVAELPAAPGFRDYQFAGERVTLQLTPADFLGLALSSSHARPAIEALGKETAERLLIKSVRQLISRDGHIPYGYRFQMFSVRSDGVRLSP
jgi:SAM-dependent methyltransferase